MDLLKLLFLLIWMTWNQLKSGWFDLTDYTLYSILIDYVSMFYIYYLFHMNF